VVWHPQTILGMVWPLVAPSLGNHTIPSMATSGMAWGLPYHTQWDSFTPTPMVPPAQNCVHIFINDIWWYGLGLDPRPVRTVRFCHAGAPSTPGTPHRL